MLSSKNENFRELVSATMTLITSQELKTLFMRSAVIFRYYLIKYVKIWNICKFSKHIFSKWWGMALQNHVWVKDSFKLQKRPMDFNEAEYKMFVIVISESPSQHFKKLPVVKFKGEYLQFSKGYWNTPPFSIYISMLGHIFFIYFNQNHISQQSKCRGRHGNSAVFC